MAGRRQLNDSHSKGTITVATELQVQGANVKQQSVWAWLGLTLITLGIYNLFWYYRVNREMKEVGGALGNTELGASSPGMSVFSQFIPIANLVSIHKTGRRIQQVQVASGRPGDYNMLVHWILIIFTGLWPMYAQSVLNGLWETAQSASAPTATTPVSASPIS